MEHLSVEKTENIIPITKQSVYFIVNPFSGIGKKKQLEQIIPKFLNLNRFDFKLVYTEFPGHAKTLAATAVKENFDIIVAVGGDGSVNEVACSLIGTDKVLGILPGGSGNGFAMHLGLGRNIKKAISFLNHGKIVKIDTCEVNGQPFINLSGVGFDATVAYKSKKSKWRGLFAYVRFSLAEAISFQFPTYTIYLDDQPMTKTCLTIEVANAPMFGYNFQIAPRAKFNDGLFEVVIIKKAPKWKYFLLGWRMLNGTFHKSSLTENYTAKKVVIELKQPTPVHYDGEGVLMDQHLHFSIKPLSLNVLVPGQDRSKEKFGIT